MKPHVGGKNEAPKCADTQLRGKTAATLACMLLLCIAMATYFVNEDMGKSAHGAPRNAPPDPATDNALARFAVEENTVKADPPKRKKGWLIYHDTPIKVTPNVLICATNGRGPADKLAAALDAYCTHAIYTGPMIIAREGSKRRLRPGKKGAEGFQVFMSLTKVYERYVSLREDLTRKNQNDVLQAVIAFLRNYKLRGIELVLSNNFQGTKLLRFCQNFVYNMKSNDSLLIKVARTVPLIKNLFERLASVSTFVILETQAGQMPSLHTRRFPNPYQPFNGSTTKDIYMRYRLWKVHPWRRRLHLDNVCFTMSMAVIKGRKRAAGDRILDYSYTNLKEPCLQQDMEKGIDVKAISHYRENQTVYYAYDNRQTIIEKLWRLSHEFPRYCVAVYDVEMDDFENACPKMSVPRLGVVRKLVTSTMQSKRL